MTAKWSVRADREEQFMSDFQAYECPATLGCHLRHLSAIVDALTREGVLINVSVRYWRATKKLNAEDLGLDPESVETRLISLGHKNLIPRESLQTFALIEGRTHALVEGSTFPFLNGLGHFLPNARLQETTDKLAQLEREFMAEKEGFLERYAETRDKALVEWREAAARLVSNPAKSPGLSIMGPDVTLIFTPMASARI